MIKRSNPELVIVSGLSGSGKTIALRALEDADFYCTDNLPVALLPSFTQHLGEDRRAAVGLDIRSGGIAQKNIDTLLQQLRALGHPVKVVFLTASIDRLVQRFSETKRRHPLADHHSLIQAIAAEEQLLAPLRECADWVIDTSDTNLHQLRQRLWNLLEGTNHNTLVLKSFAFRHGLPADLDLIFDARCLPNPHWQEELRPLTGRDEAIQSYLDQEQKAQALLADIQQFLTQWVPEYQHQHRSQFTVGIGCTGGRHRSVYIVEKLANCLTTLDSQIIVHHRELS